MKEESTLYADLCIVGAGPAGITLTQQLARTGRQILLIESGKTKPDPKIQDLYQGETPGLPYDLRNSRRRQFGGSSNCWAGMIARLDQTDFRKRSYVPYSGWPIDLGDLLPYYEQAERSLGAASFSLSAHESDGREPLPLSSRIRTKVYQVRQKRYREELEALKKLPGVTVLLETNLTEIESRPSGKTVQRLHLTTLGGARLTAVGKQYVLAAGAVENARLLLHSRSVHRKGIGNDRDLVGRFFMEHPHIDGELRLLSVPQKFRFYERSGSLYPAFALTEDTLEKEKLLNSGIFYLGEIGMEEEGLSEAVQALASRLEKAEGTRLLVMGNPCEQPPNPESRVTLSETERDALGIPRAVLHWQVDQQTYRSLHRSNTIFSEALSGAGHGRAQIRYDPDTKFEKPAGGNHHMGTTRMSSTDREGVVDPNLQVFGVDNLSVLGSSVFPTSGAANPTLTILALAFRLGDHLNGRLHASA